MPGRKVGCPHCSKVMRSDNLKKHIKKHTESSNIVVGQKRTSEDHQSVKNPKIRALVNAIVGSNKGWGTTTQLEEEKKKEVDDTSYPEKTLFDEILSDDSMMKKEKEKQEFLSDEEESSSDYTESLPPPPDEDVNDVFQSMINSMPRTKEEIMEWCHSDEDTDGEDDDESSITSSSVSDPNLEKLSHTAKDLYNRFKLLHCQFVRRGKYENRNDLTFLLSEMQRKGFITQEDYEKGIDSLDIEMKMEVEEELEDVINSTVRHVIEHDKKELLEVLEELTDQVDEEEEEDGTVGKLRKLINNFLVSEFSVKGQPILPMIDEVVKSLEGTQNNIQKSTLNRLQALVEDIDKNRYRIKAVLSRLNDARDEEDRRQVLKRLAQEDLLSDIQYSRVEAVLEKGHGGVAGLLPVIAGVVKEMKIGRGLDFLPTRMLDLKNKLRELVGDLIETAGLSSVRKELSAVLDELLRRHGISLKIYTSIKKDNNIL